MPGFNPFTGLKDNIVEGTTKIPSTFKTYIDDNINPLGRASDEPIQEKAGSVGNVNPLGRASDEPTYVGKADANIVVKVPDDEEEPYLGKAGSNITVSIPHEEDLFSDNQTFLNLNEQPIMVLKDGLSPNIIGLPPHAYLSVSDGNNSNNRLNKLTIAAMPVLEIEPCLPRFGSGGSSGAGLQLFSLDPTTGMQKWRDIVTHCGFKNEATAVGNGPIKIAFLNETSLGESWSSQFGETDFESMMNQGSSLAQSVRMITGSDNMSDAAKQIGGAFGETGADIGSKIGGAIGGVEGGIDKLFGNVGHAGRQLFTGSRVDFPQVWQGSSYEPSYNLTVRLYNPWPNDAEAYKRFILAPLCMILAMTVPISDSKWTYNFPLFCRARCSGLFDLPSAAFSSVRVVKGGDTNDVSWHQQPGTIDLQITLDSLFQTMVASTGSENSADDHEERPTLKKYFDSLRSWVDYKSPFDSPANSNAVPRDAGGLDLDAIMAATNPQTDQIETAIRGRVPAEASNIFEELSEGAFDPAIFGTLSDKALLMSGVTEQLDDIKNSVTNGVGDIVGKVSGSISNFDIGGLDIATVKGYITEFTSAGFSGAFDLETILQGPIEYATTEVGEALRSASTIITDRAKTVSSMISGKMGFPGGISAGSS